MPAPAPAFAPRVVAAAPVAPVALPPAGNLLAPAPGFGVTPVGFGAGYNPGLLFAAPFGSPLRTLAGTDPASAVTTASQVQAMALDNLPRGLGIPAVLGVLILAGLAGLAVRHRMLSRRRG